MLANGHMSGRTGARGGGLLGTVVLVLTPGAVQARLTPLEFAQFLLSRSEISSSAGSLMAAADTFAPVDAGGTTRRPAAAAAAAAGAVASFLRPSSTRPL